MFCPNCGKEIVVNSEKCENCGYIIKKQDHLVNELNKSNRLSTQAKSKNDRMTTKWLIIAIEAACIVLVFLPWIHFVGGLESQYNLITLPNFATNEKDYLYWILYDVWDHKGARHFKEFADLIRIFAFIIIGVHGLSIGTLLKDTPRQYFASSVAAIWSLGVSTYYFGWMVWFKFALMTYDDYSFGDVFHFTLTPIIVIILSVYSLNILNKIKKRAIKASSQA